LAEIVDSDPAIVVPFEAIVVPFEEIVVDSEAFDAVVDPFPDTAPVVPFDVDRIVEVMTEVPLLVLLTGIVELTDIFELTDIVEPLTAIVEFSETFDTDDVTVAFPSVDVPFDAPVVSETFKL